MSSPVRSTHRSERRPASWLGKTVVAVVAGAGLAAVAVGVAPLGNASDASVAATGARAAKPVPAAPAADAAATDPVDAESAPKPAAAAPIAAEAELPAATCPAGGGDLEITKSCVIRTSASYGNVTIMNGARVFVADAGLTLKFRSLVAMGEGSAFLAGCPTALTKKLTIVMTEKDANANPHGMGAGVLGAHGGQLCLKGERRDRRFDKVARGYAAGTTTVETQRAMNLRKGDRVLFTASTNSPASAQVVTVTEGSGTTFSFTPALRTAVLGTTVTRGGRTLPMYTEVARLSGSTVVVKTATGTLGHVMGMGSTATMQIAGVDLVKMGTGFGRYCAHMHLMGNQPNSYVVNSACDVPNSRAFVMHGTNSARFQDLVSWRSRGTSFLLGEGCPEKNNHFLNLLAANPRSATLGTDDFDAVGQADRGPSGFWSCASNNTFNGLYASGVDGGWGIRLDFERFTKNRGLLSSTPGNPQRYKAGVIRGLYVHSIAEPTPGHLVERFMGGTGVFISGKIADGVRDYTFGRYKVDRVVVWKANVGVWAGGEVTITRGAVGDTGRAYVLQNARVDQGMCTGLTGVGERTRVTDPQCTESYDFATMFTNGVMADYGWGKLGAIGFWDAYGYDQVVFYGIPLFANVNMVNVGRVFAHKAPDGHEAKAACTAPASGLAAWLSNVEGGVPGGGDGYLGFPCAVGGTQLKDSTFKVVPVSQRAKSVHPDLYDGNYHDDPFRAGAYTPKLPIPPAPAKPAPPVEIGVTYGG